MIEEENKEKKEKTSDKPFYEPKNPRQNLNKDDLTKSPVLKNKPKEEKQELVDFQIIDRKTGLNLREELFCRVYTSETEFFGNGVQTYIEVYKPDMSNPNWYNLACVKAHNILSKVKVFARINTLLAEQGFNHLNSDKQLGFLMNQFADFKAKIAAIREYNRVTKRVDDAPKIPTSFEVMIVAPPCDKPCCRELENKIETNQQEDDLSNTPRSSGSEENSGELRTEPKTI